MSSSLSSMRPSSLLSAAAAGGTAPPSRSATAAVAKAARGFHLFRIDGYSLTTSLPGGERISSEPFTVGRRRWVVDYYPNGVDASTDDSDAIAVYLRLHGPGRKERVRAEFKFSLLDSAGNAAYELPAERGIFVSTGGYGSDSSDEDEAKPSSCGYAVFITKEDLGRRRESLLREDSLAIRCDVGVAEVETVAVGRRRQRNTRRRSPSTPRYSSDSPESDDDEDGGGSSRGRRHGQPPPPDDKGYIRRCLASSFEHSLASSKRRKY